MILPVVIMEIGRKMVHRVSHKGIQTSDTYAYEWGEGQAIFVFSALFIVGGVIGWNTGLIRSSGIISFFFGVFCLVMLYQNLKVFVKITYYLHSGTLLLPCMLLFFAMIKYTIWDKNKYRRKLSGNYQPSHIFICETLISGCI